MKNLIIIFVLFISTIVSAQSILVAGTQVDCGTWISARKNNTSSHYEHYLLGLLNGLALGRGVEVWQRKNTSTTVTTVQFYYWMDAYCQKNPLEGVMPGSLAFANEMSNGDFNKAYKK